MLNLMPDDELDMTSTEFWRTRESGKDVQIALSRDAFLATVGNGGAPAFREIIGPLVGTTGQNGGNFPPDAALA
jgi:hypothetical protein